MDQPISPTATSSKTNWLLLSLIGVVNLIVGAAIGLLMGKYIYTPKSTSLISGPTPNWQTYTNSTFDFSIQYPPAWKVTADVKPEGAQFIDEQPVILIHDGQLRPDPDVGPDSTYPSHYVGISTLASSKTLQEFLDSIVLGFSPKVQKDIREFMDQKMLTVNGIPAVSFIEPGMGGRGKMIAVSNGKYIVLFSFPYQLDGEKDDYFTQDKDYTQILSTFKFIDQDKTFCGGKRGIRCPNGYTCKFDGYFPDASGICVIPQEGTLKATVIRSPTCAGPITNQESCEAPVAYEMFRITRLYDGEVVQTINTDKDGKFTVSLPVDNYGLRGTSGIGKRIGNQDFTIIAGKTITQRFDIDTGIR